MIPRSQPPLGSRPIAETVSGRNLATSSAQPAVSLLTEKNHPSGSTTTSKRSFDTSIPQKESMAIFCFSRFNAFADDRQGHVGQGRSHGRKSTQGKDQDLAKPYEPERHERGSIRTRP